MQNKETLKPYVFLIIPQEKFRSNEIGSENEIKWKAFISETTDWYKLAATFEPRWPVPLCSHQNCAQANQSPSNRFASVQALHDNRDVSLFNNPGLKKVSRFRKIKSRPLITFKMKCLSCRRFLSPSSLPRPRRSRKSWTNALVKLHPILPLSISGMAQPICGRVSRDHYRRRNDCRRARTLFMTALSPAIIRIALPSWLTHRCLAFSTISSRSTRSNWPTFTISHVRLRRKTICSRHRIAYTSDW